MEFFEVFQGSEKDGMPFFRVEMWDRGKHQISFLQDEELPRKTRCSIRVPMENPAAPSGGISVFMGYLPPKDAIPPELVDMILLTLRAKEEAVPEMGKLVIREVGNSGHAVHLIKENGQEAPIEEFPIVTDCEAGLKGLTTREAAWVLAYTTRAYFAAGGRRVGIQEIRMI